MVIKFLYQKVVSKVAVASKWEDIGLKLGIDIHALDNIKVNHPNNVEACCGRMLGHWIQETKDTNATQLLNALRSDNVSLHSIADEIEQWMKDNHITSSCLAAGIYFIIRILFMKFRDIFRVCPIERLNDAGQIIYLNSFNY